ncbi:MAG: DUF4625 domain-containing protein [Chlorobi bacterium]|nr:DUF4625 domain-containing protein [Chlorobiota bacterium]
MKEKLFFITVLFAALFFTGCKDDDDDSVDTEKPVITILKPVDGDVYATGELITFSANFIDNKELKNCKVTLGIVSGNGDGTAWTPGETNIALSGTTMAVTDRDLFGVIPDCETGTYKLTVEVSDAAEVPNINIHSLNIDIISNTPVLNVEKPAEGSTYVSGEDYLLLTATCSDNNELKELVYYVTYLDAGSASLKGTTGVNDPWDPGRATISLSGSSEEFNDEVLYGGQIPVSKAGNYKLTLELFDTDGNSVVKEINFQLVDAS